MYTIQKFLKTKPYWFDSLQYEIWHRLVQDLMTQQKRKPRIMISLR
jgi:hypothetical protein